MALLSLLWLFEASLLFLLRSVDVVGVQCPISVRNSSTKASHDLTHPRIGLFHPASIDMEAAREANGSGDCRQFHATGEPPPL